LNVLEQKVSTTPKAMQEVFGGMPRSQIALETGMHSPWVSRLLSELGHEVIVAHARNVRLIGESRKKDDRLDAQSARGSLGSKQPDFPESMSVIAIYRQLTPHRPASGVKILV
jgi:transposase